MVLRVIFRGRPCRQSSLRWNHSVRDLVEKARTVPSDAEPSRSRTRVGKASMFLQWTLIPGTFLYMALYADFGERDHVFSDLRRWVQNQKNQFWELSPEERQLVGRTDTNVDPLSQKSSS